jgi:carboxy-terminal domain RNA polymerase II polypeptide A small phosphatase
MSKDKDMLSPDDGTHQKKGRGMLHVPSRSSSQRNQSSLTTTGGLSGVTVSESRNSISARSKESKGSMLGRQRNGSLSSHRSNLDTEPTNTPGNSQPSSPAGTSPQKKKKNGGFLSFLGCCTVPEHGNPLEGDSEAIHKLDKLPARPTTAKSRQPTPQEQPSTSKTQLQEKELQPQPPLPITTSAITTNQDTSKGKRVSNTTTGDQSTVAGDDEPKPVVNIAPGINVEPPNGTKSDSRTMPNDALAVDGEGDHAMKDAQQDEPEDAEGESLPRSSAQAADTHSKTIPPPPPGPAPVTATTVPVYDVPSASAPEPQRALLPPIAPEHKGRKCLVLDLDETLVHSSFKVSGRST